MSSSQFGYRYQIGTSSASDRRPELCNGLQTPATSGTVAQPRCGSAPVGAGRLLSFGDRFLPIPSKCPADARFRVAEGSRADARFATVAIANKGATAGPQTGDADCRSLSRDGIVVGRRERPFRASSSSEAATDALHLSFPLNGAISRAREDHLESSADSFAAAAGLAWTGSPRTRTWRRAGSR